jgi:hypothetical protein
MNFKITEMKEELIKHLQTKRIDGVCTLWGEAKSYYKNKLIEMGGGYASCGKDISVTLNVNGVLERFKVSIDECK